MELPQQYDKDIYLEVRKIVRTHSNTMPAESEVALAFVAGGSILKAAADTMEFPPCTENGICAVCEINEFCVHSKTPVGIRLLLSNALRVFTTPDLVVDERVIEMVRYSDKTDPTDVGKIMEIARVCGRKIEQKLEKAKNDQAKNISRDCTA